MDLPIVKQIVQCTAVTVVSLMNIIIRSTDEGQISALSYSTIVQPSTWSITVLFYVMQHHFVLEGSSLNWFKSYLTNRSQVFSVNGIKSPPFNLECIVPQGSVVGPLEFKSYTVVDVFNRNCVSPSICWWHASTRLRKNTIRRRLVQWITNVRQCVLPIDCNSMHQKPSLNGFTAVSQTCFSSVRSWCPPWYWAYSEEPRKSYR